MVSQLAAANDGRAARADRVSNGRAAGRKRSRRRRAATFAADRSRSFMIGRAAGDRGGIQSVRSELQSFAEASRVGRLSGCECFLVSGRGVLQWLSKQEGIAIDQWCYDVDAQGNVAKMKEKFLSLAAYRLPTEPEMEYVEARRHDQCFCHFAARPTACCRAMLGIPTARSRTPGLLAS